MRPGTRTIRFRIIRRPKGAAQRFEVSTEDGQTLAVDSIGELPKGLQALSESQGLLVGERGLVAGEGLPLELSFRTWPGHRSLRVYLSRGRSKASFLLRVNGRTGKRLTLDELFIESRRLGEVLLTSDVMGVTLTVRITQPST